MSDNTCIVGIAGGTASGKTTIVRKIKEKFGDDIVVINHDSYYKAHDDLSYEDRSRLNERISRSASSTTVSGCASAASRKTSRRLSSIWTNASMVASRSQPIGTHGIRYHSTIPIRTISRRRKVSRKRPPA